MRGGQIIFPIPKYEVTDWDLMVTRYETAKFIINDFSACSAR